MAFAFDYLGIAEVTTSTSTFNIEGRTLETLLRINPVQEEFNRDEEVHVTIDGKGKNLDVSKREEPEKKKLLRRP